MTDLIYYTLKPVDKTMLIPVLPVSPETGFDYGEIESPSRSALFSIFGFVLLGLVKSVVIGFLVGKKSIFGIVTADMLTRTKTMARHSVFGLQTYNSANTSSINTTRWAFEYLNIPYTVDIQLIEITLTVAI